MRPRHPALRTAFTVTETVVACVILGALLTVSGQMLRAVVQQRRAADLRTCAVWEATNQMEQITLEAYDELTPENLARRELSPEVARQLRDGELTVSVEPVEAPAGKRLTVEVRWRGMGGGTARPVRLVSWMYRPVEESEAESTQSGGGSP